jgi:hypothetical protein
MTLMLSKTYDALRSADGVSDEQAREAAEEIAAYETRLSSIESRLMLLTWMVGTNLAVTIAVLFRLLVN